jgi:hypothetical protein
MTTERYKPLLAGLALAAGLGAAGETPAPSPVPATIRVESVSPALVQPLSEPGAAIFYDGFDSEGDLRSRYFEYDDSNGSFVRAPGEGYGGGNAAVRCRFEKGQVAAGSLKVLFGKNPFHRGIRPDHEFREVYWRVYVKHEAGWTGNPAKLARATCLAGTDWSQGLIAHVWGGAGDALCIDPATGITDSRKVSTKYNDFDHLKWLGLRNSETPIFSPAESGRWVCVESHVKVNTPGRKDGVFELWVDGKREAARDDLDWHGTWNEYAIDAVFLENYWNGGSVKAQSRWFDGFTISEKPVGPITSARVPALTRTPGDGVDAWEAQVASDVEGRDAVWGSRPQPGGSRTLSVTKSAGAFLGSRRGKAGLAPHTVHWVRLRQRSPSGTWSGWTTWHSPFRTPA